jgi:hypothetical protein
MGSNFFKTLILVFLIHPSADSATGWTEFESKLGWKINIPPCWEAATTDDTKDIKQVKNVIFVPKKECYTEFSQDTVVQIIIPDVKLETPEKMLSRNTQVKQQLKYDFILENLDLKPVHLQSIKSFAEMKNGKVEEKMIAWNAYSNCNGKNLHYYMRGPIPKDSQNVSLEKQTMPEVLKKITDSFVCTKP